MKITHFAFLSIPKPSPQTPQKSLLKYIIRRYIERERERERESILDTQKKISPPERQNLRPNIRFLYRGKYCRTKKFEFFKRKTIFETTNKISQLETLFLTSNTSLLYRKKHFLTRTYDFSARKLFLDHF